MDRVDQRARSSAYGPRRARTAKDAPSYSDLWTIIQRLERTDRYAQKQTTLISRYVFHHDGHAIIDINKTWAKACTNAGVGPRLFHGFGRTAIRNMVRASVAETVGVKISGHKTRSV